MTTSHADHHATHRHGALAGKRDFGPDLIAWNEVDQRLVVPALNNVPMVFPGAERINNIDEKPINPLSTPSDVIGEAVALGRLPYWTLACLFNAKGLLWAQIIGRGDSVPASGAASVVARVLGIDHSHMLHTQWPQSL